MVGMPLVSKGKSLVLKTNPCTFLVHGIVEFGYNLFILGLSLLNCEMEVMFHLAGLL